MKTVGIIGGFGPETTAQFQLKIIDLCHKRGASIRPHILMWNTPISLVMESNLILKNRGINKFKPFLIDAAQKLEMAGADFLVLPCNSLHVLLNDIKNSVSIPILSILDETVQHLLERKVNKIGLVSTEFSIKRNLHFVPLAKSGIHPLLPTNQNRINQAILSILKLGNNKFSKSIIMDSIKDFKQKGVNDILLACTDLPLIPISIKNIHIFDTLDILALATVREMMS